MLMMFLPRAFLVTYGVSQPFLLRLASSVTLTRDGVAMPTVDAGSICFGGVFPNFSSQLVSEEAARKSHGTSLYVP